MKNSSQPTQSLQSLQSNFIIDSTMNKLTELKSTEILLKTHGVLKNEERAKLHRIQSQIKDTQAFLDKLLSPTDTTLECLEATI